MSKMVTPQFTIAAMDALQFWPLKLTWILKCKLQADNLYHAAVIPG